MAGAEGSRRTCGWNPYRDGTHTEKTRLNLKQHIACANSYEQLVDQLRQRDERDLLEKLNLLMAYALTPPINDNPKVDNAFVEKEDLYDRFLPQALS
jgi:hypothetical protein